MTNSKKLAGLIGPVLTVVAATENPVVNPNLYDTQIPPLVYFSGTLLFIAGLAIVRSHNHWSLRWPVLITLVGWLAMVLGLLRMVFPHAYIGASASQSAFVTGTIYTLLFVGIFLSYKAYISRDQG